MSSSWQQRLRFAAIPSTVFAAVVFSFGWLEVSPFASWPLGLIGLLCGPAMIPFVLFVVDLARRSGGRGFRNAFSVSPVPPTRFRWRDVFTTRRATFVGALVVLVFVSFFQGIADYRGSPTILNGELVFTDHGEVVGPATEREADAARTRSSRLVSGHFMLFGVIGLLARVPPTTDVSRGERPVGRAHMRRGRPGGPRESPETDE